MDEATVDRLVRRAIREPKPKRVDADDLTSSKQDAVNLIGQRLLAAEPEYFKTRTSLTSYTNIFTLPSACDRVVSVWDMGGNAFSVSATASNSGVIRVTTSAVHGLATSDIVTIHGVLGTTEANGTWKITVISTTVFDLQDSTYANAWTSGGKVFKEAQDYDRIVRMPDGEATGNNADKWYLDGSKIVVDDPTYTYDLIINYRYVPSSTVVTALTEIPSKFHFGIVSYCVVDLIPVAAVKGEELKNLKTTYEYHVNQLNIAWKLINDFSISKESKSLGDVSRIKRRI
jgi:hypothetical protein